MFHHVIIRRHAAAVEHGNTAAGDAPVLLLGVNPDVRVMMGEEDGHHRASRFGEHSFQAVLKRFPILKHDYYFRLAVEHSRTTVRHQSHNDRMTLIKFTLQ